MRRQGITVTFSGDAMQAKFTALLETDTPGIAPWKLSEGLEAMLEVVTRGIVDAGDVVLGKTGPMEIGLQK